MSPVIHNIDYLIIGAGFYGLYAACILSDRGVHVSVIEKDSECFQRASYVNQARIHNGYHYPRSLATAKKTREYYDRFHFEYGFCIHSKFDKIYAIAKNFSLTNPSQFENFCKAAEIAYKEIPVSKYFNPDEILSCYQTEETTYDAKILASHLLDKLRKKNVSIHYNESVVSSQIEEENFLVTTNRNNLYRTKNVLNATYAGINQVNLIFQAPMENVKYELCEVALVKPSQKLEGVGLTVMDGPFFSLMPFGKTGLHSLTAVTYTPIRECSEPLPEFPCQTPETECSKYDLKHCNLCISKPRTEYPYMRQIASKYLSPELRYEYDHSLFTIKTVLRTSEMDDSRPTVIREFGKKPRYRTVFSGKINTVFDLEEELLHDLQG